MNREFKPTPGRIRTALAAAAMVATMLLALSIEGLIDHYNGAGSWLANVQPVAFAQR